MDTYFKVTTANRKLEAYLNVLVDIIELPTFEEDDYLSFLKENGICFGIIHENMSMLINNRLEVQFPLLIASGNAPINGDNGYLKNEITVSETHVDNEKPLNFREIIKIPSVQNGDLLAKIIPPTNGVDGIDVFGNGIVARSGKPFQLKKGKNIDVIDDCIYSKIDGQVSVNGNFIDVFPVFEVKGDLDLKTGNINFIGSVTINGDVPEGYQINAGGDIKVFGVVEGSHLEANGSIYISGGIIGGNNGSIVAKGNIISAYINQAVVSANHDIEVRGAILHSTCSAGGKIICKSGSIIGGNISAGTSILAKEVGNRVYTKTELFIGDSKDFVTKEKNMRKELKEVTDNLMKLTAFTNNLAKKYQSTGSLTNHELELLKKQKSVKEQLELAKNQLIEEINEIQHSFHDQSESEVIVYNIIYPNVHINFGKYCYISVHELKNIKYYLDRGEIVSAPLS